MSYFLSASGKTLFAQVNKRFPNRDTASDGWVGDTSHAATVSDHNPCWTCSGDRYGVVRAVDIDANLTRKDPEAARKLANQLVKLAKDGKDGDRLSYVIFNRQIASSTYGWGWRPYSGANTHEHHIHVSFNGVGDFRTAKFGVPILSTVDRVLLEKLRSAKAETVKQIKKLKAKLAELSKKIRKVRG